jgi:hypothetical protein
MPDPNTTLMQSIHAKWGSAITAACAKSTVPAAFLAGLVANESGGDADAKRFEKAVLGDLWEVLQGRKANYGSIDRDNILAFLAAAAPANPSVPSAGFVRSIVSSALQQLDGLANSWGLTQIMGYEAIAFPTSLSALKDPASELQYTLRMFAQFGSRFSLDLGKDFSELFSCWNTGRAHARTADPEYVPNGLLRMQIYQQLVTGDS